MLVGGDFIKISIGKVFFVVMLLVMLLMFEVVCDFWFVGG